MAILETRGLCFSYPDGTRALRGVDVRVPAGGFVALLGPNGSGKTTLFHHLNGLLHPTEGEVRLKGRSLKEIPVTEVHRTIGLVFQDPDSQLFAPTVADDVAFGPRNLGVPEPEVQERVQDALRLVSILPLAGKVVHGLSYGQKKRAAIAGILAMRPEVMILDEPTAGLDPVGADRVMELLRHLNESLGITVLLGTHDVDIVPAYATQVLVLKEGEILADGSPRQVFAQPEVIESARLRLPYVAQLVQGLRRDRGEAEGALPLTVAEAHAEISRMLHTAAADAEPYPSRRHGA